MTGNDTNSRTTVAVLGTKIDHLTNTVESAVDEMKEQAKRTTEVEKCIAVLTIEYESLDKEVENMDDRYKKINIATAIGATVGTTFATVLAIFGIRQ